MSPGPIDGQPQGTGIAAVSFLGILFTLKRSRGVRVRRRGWRGWILVRLGLRQCSRGRRITGRIIRCWRVTRSGRRWRENVRLGKVRALLVWSPGRGGRTGHVGRVVSLFVWVVLVIFLSLLVRSPAISVAIFTGRQSRSGGGSRSSC